MLSKRNTVLLAFGGVLLAALVMNGARRTEGVYANRFASARGAMSTSRSHGASVSLKNGKVLLIGGSTAHGVTASVETYEVGEGFHPAASMHFPRSEQGAVLLSDGTVLVA